MKNIHLDHYRLSLVLYEFCEGGCIVNWHVCNTYIKSENILKKYGYFLKNHRKIITKDKWVENYVDFEFRMLFRLTKRSFIILYNEIMATYSNLLKKPYRGGYPSEDPQKSLLMFLRYLATEETLLSVASRFCIVPSTLHKIIHIFLNIFMEMKSRYIFWPQTHHEYEYIASTFRRYPNVIGSIDGCHIQLKVSDEDQNSYIDRFHQHSVNLMAICTHAKILTYIFVGFPGSAHDSRVFKNSEFYLNIQRYGPEIYFPDKKFHIIGDSAFGCYSWLMTPFKNATSEKEKYHNFIHSSDRVVIENLFALLKGRWRKLTYINVYSIPKAVKIIVAACILHNWCILQNDVWTEEYTYEKHYDIQEESSTRDGIEKRKNIADALFANR